MTINRSGFFGVNDDKENASEKIIAQKCIQEVIRNFENNVLLKKLIYLVNGRISITVNLI